MLFFLLPTIAVSACLFRHSMRVLLCGGRARRYITHEKTTLTKRVLISWRTFKQARGHPPIRSSLFAAFFLKFGKTNLLGSSFFLFQVVSICCRNACARSLDSIPMRDPPWCLALLYRRQVRKKDNSSWMQWNNRRLRYHCIHARPKEAVPPRSPDPDRPDTRISTVTPPRGPLD